MSTYHVLKQLCMPNEPLVGRTRNALHHPHYGNNGNGFIALISAVIIATILLALSISMSSSSLFSRFDALNREFKRLSLGFAESCITTALGRISSDFTYTTSNTLVPLGTLYGKPAECTISSVTATAPVNGKKTFTITAKANFNGAYSTITTQAVGQDPLLAPVVPPPTCALNPTAVSVPGASSVPFAWSTAGSNITSFTMDRGVGTLFPFSSGTGSFIAPISSGTYTYTATVANAGGNSTCRIDLTVTPQPPTPACADTVMILDRTGSMSGSDLTNERNASNALTNLYASVASLPKIGVGSFGAYPNASLPTGAASVPTNGQLTATYSTILSLITSLTGSTSSVGSNLGAAINVGATELASVRHTPSKQKVLIFVSDGVPNEPSTPTFGNTGFQAPTAHSANNTLTGDQWTAPAQAYGAGNATDAGAHRHQYRDFNFSIPSLATIRGVEIAATAQNTTLPATTMFNETFGTGSSVNDIPAWEEEGSDNDSTTLALTPGTGQDSASPDGGRFARIGQDEWICRNVNASGLSSLALSFYWRGDSDSESSDTMFVEYSANGTSCDTGTSWSAAASDNLNGFTTSWSPRQTVLLPASLNNDASFFIRFRVNSNNTNEELRIDGVSLNSTPPACNLGVDLSWNNGGSWTTERVQTLSNVPTTYTLGAPTDTWGRTWSVSEFTNGSFRTRVRATATGSTCSLDTLTARVSYSIPVSPSQYALDAASAARNDGVNIFSIHYGDVAGQSLMAQLASNSTINVSPITTAIRVSNIATISTSVAHHLTANQRVQLSGVSNAIFNGTFTVLATPSPSTFTFTLSGTGTINATGGSARPTNLFIAPATSAMTGIFQSIGSQVCPAAAPSCSNTVDDDGDGTTDEEDNGCHTDGNPTNPASFDPSDTDEWTIPATPVPPPPPPPPPNITIGSWVETP